MDVIVEGVSGNVIVEGVCNVKVGGVSDVIVDGGWVRHSRVVSDVIVDGLVTSK